MKKFITKISNFLKDPYFIGAFLLVSLIILFYQPLKVSLLPTTIEILKYIVSTAFGGIVTYIGLMALETKKSNTAAFNVVNAVIRRLSHQYLQLKNLEMLLKNRQELLNKKIPLAREDIIAISQDFREDLYRIDLQQLYSLPAPKINRDQFEEALLSVFLCDRRYYSILNGILILNDAKRIILKQDSDIPEYLAFLTRNIPDHLNIIQNALTRNKNTLNEFQEALKEIFGDKIKKISYGEIYSKE